MRCTLRRLHRDIVRKNKLCGNSGFAARCFERNDSEEMDVRMRSG